MRQEGVKAWVEAGARRILKEALADAGVAINPESPLRMELEDLAEMAKAVRADVLCFVENWRERARELRRMFKNEEPDIWNDRVSTMRLMLWSADAAEKAMVAVGADL